MATDGRLRILHAQGLGDGTVRLDVRLAYLKSEPVEHGTLTAEEAMALAAELITAALQSRALGGPE